ncbi:MAG TPA: pentapeptide repeat-containing protein [Planctomycetaceae bacterium]|nr:pentapeptide repeat-containing protein [Planctomycetaceae bacterium]
MRVWLEEGGAPRCLRILGGPGSGKTTALAHLADFFDDGFSRITFVDAGKRLNWEAYASPSGFIISEGDRIPADAPVQTLTLAPWSRDELIEYLLATHPKECASVLSRLTRAEEQQFRGVPELWRVALDELAGDPSLGGPVDAVIGYLQRSVTSPEVYRQLESSCLEGECRPSGSAQKGARPPVAFASHPGGLADDVFHLLRHAMMRRNLAALGLVAQLKTGDWKCDFLTSRLPRDLVVAAGARLKNSSEAIDELKSAALSDETEAMAASLLHAACPVWVPSPKKRSHFLEGAYLDGVHWPGIQLPKARLNQADLTQADLREANLDEADASGAILILARLSGASLNCFQASGTNLSGADLSAVRGSRVFFFGADLSQTKLDNATLFDASFWEADLRQASLRGAELTRAGFQRAVLEETDFSGANLNEADLSDCVLRTSCLTGASLRGARLMNSDLEGMCLDGLNFSEARLEGALLTGSSMVNGNLAGACLRNAGLGDIDWPGVCLRGADLRQATFHMGSSRSGLVDSTIASEGSRTGFYSDEYSERDFKSPEEIRKANLCRADLRGAIIDGVDFYLVDLRGARYDIDQKRHFRRCGAILENHCPP